jgi:hypothetical protein
MLVCIVTLIVTKSLDELTRMQLSQKVSSSVVGGQRKVVDKGLSFLLLEVFVVSWN